MPKEFLCKCQQTKKTTMIFREKKVCTCSHQTQKLCTYNKEGVCMVDNLTKNFIPNCGFYATCPRKGKMGNTKKLCKRTGEY